MKSSVLVIGGQDIPPYFAPEDVPWFGYIIPELEIFAEIEWFEPDWLDSNTLYTDPDYYEESCRCCWRIAMPDGSSSGKTLALGEGEFESDIEAYEDLKATADAGGIAIPMSKIFG